MAKSNHYNCIYRIVFPNGKCYVGQAKDFNSRQQGRLCDYNKWLIDKDDETATDLERRGSNPKLFRAFLKYGVENCELEILEEDIENSDLLNEREIYWIAFYNCVEDGYNISAGGNYVGLNPETGRGYTYRCSTEYSVPYSDNRSAWNKEYYQKHREEIRKKQNEDYKNGGNIKRKERYLENREIEIEYSRNYREENPEKWAETRRKYAENHSDKILKYAKDYYEKNRNEILKRRKDYRESNRDEYLQYRKDWRNKNLDRLREQRKEFREEHNAKNREYKEQNKDKIKERRKIDSEIRRKLSEADKEIFVTCATAICFRRFFGGGRTRVRFFIEPKGVVNEQGCWLFDFENRK